MSDERRICGVGLSRAQVSACGREVELGFTDRGGCAVTIALPHEALGMLLMTLPRLIEMSLQRRTRKANLRHVYPLGEWQLEAAQDGASLLLRLATTDGFAVSFCLPAAVARSLGDILVDASSQSLSPRLRSLIH